MTRLIVQQFVSSKSVISIISWLLSLMAIALLACVYYFLSTLDNLAESELKQRAELALYIENEHHEDILSEYAFWNFAYQKVYVDFDPEWVERNIGQYLLDHYEFDISIAIAPGDQMRAMSVDEQEANLTYEQIMDAGLSQLLTATAEGREQEESLNGYLKLNEDVYYFLSGHFVEEFTEQPRSGHYLVLGIKVDQEYLDKLSLNYQLDDLVLVTEGTSLKNSLLLYSPKGEELGALTWTPFVPSKAILPKIALVFLSLLVISICIVRHLLKKEQQDRKAYEERLYREATTDSLTKVKNRRYFMELGRNELRVHHYRQKGMCLLVMDIDHFKSINDQYGHRAGDQALVHFVTLCKQNLRKSDIIGRIGGEEFAVVLPEADIDAALEVAQRIQDNLRDSDLLINKQRLKMTVSIGIATLSNEPSFELLLEHADTAMYEAKGAGRDTTRFYKHGIAVANSAS